INMDMVGRLRNDRVIVFGSRSGFGWRRLICRNNEGPGLRLDFSWMLRATADHYPFVAYRIPVLMIHTGVHDDYHTPKDDAHLINHAGMGRIARLLFRVTHDLAERPDPPAFRPTARRETEWTRRQLAGVVSKPANRLGVRWEPQTAPGEGLRLTRVRRGLPADEAGLQSGDRVLRFAGREISVGDDLRGAVMAAQTPANMTVLSPDQTEPRQVPVQLVGKRLRLGITWREDAAEPGTVILNYVVAGSPAARAGLRIGDRIYRIAGHDFDDGTHFGQLARAQLAESESAGLPSEMFELLVERNGQLRTVVFQVENRFEDESA
ncbi:MAG: PDZ domain-containing protein, partial [bacterium]|nr:PDZ domain-containing protein [bacterium]